jgi:hypothetical protein
VPNCLYDLDDLFARLGGIWVVALKTRDRRDGLQKSNPIRFVFVCTFDTKYTSVGLG